MIGNSEEHHILDHMPQIKGLILATPWWWPSPTSISSSISGAVIDRNNTVLAEITWWQGSVGKIYWTHWEKDKRTIFLHDAQHSIQKRIVLHDAQIHSIHRFLTTLFPQSARPLEWAYTWLPWGWGPHLFHQGSFGLVLSWRSNLFFTLHFTLLCLT